MHGNLCSLLTDMYLYLYSNIIKTEIQNKSTRLFTLWSSQILLWGSTKGWTTETLHAHVLFQGIKCTWKLDKARARQQDWQCWAPLKFHSSEEKVFKGPMSFKVMWFFNCCRKSSARRHTPSDPCFVPGSQISSTLPWKSCELEERCRHWNGNEDTIISPGSRSYYLPPVTSEPVEGLTKPGRSTRFLRTCVYPADVCGWYGRKDVG